MEFDFKPEEHQEILLDLHNKIVSKEWWIFNFVGKDALWFRDQFGELFARVVGPENCVGNNLKIVREEGQSFVIRLMTLRKFSAPRAMFTLALAIRFPEMLS